MYCNIFDDFSQQSDTGNTNQRTAQTTRLNRVSDNARTLYKVLPKISWMTSANLAKSISVRKASITVLKDELEAAGLVEIHYESNGKRSNPRHKMVKVGNPINKAFNKGLYAVETWYNLDRNSLIECYLKSGLDVLPFEPREKRAAKNFDPLQWRRKASGEKMDVFFNNPDLNVGLRLPNITVVDVETKDHCWSNYDNFQNTLTASTPRGFHFYFLNDRVVRTSTKVLPDIDIRGKGTFVVLPGSIHPSGAPYEWQNLQKPCRLPIEFRREWRDSYFRFYSGSGWNDKSATITQGTRNDTLWRYGRSLRWYGKNYFEIEAALQEANLRCDPPFTQRELEKLVNHVYEHPDSKNKSRFSKISTR